ncbi:MAG: hypothetical protein KAT52_04220 [Desulfobacterales bacterium]|nr:hypothetical protein [Desulfobacterales bacterium]
MNNKINPNPEWNDFLRSIGSITISWGLAEHCLDAIIALFFKKYGSKLNEKQLPKMLSPKIKFAKKCFSRILELTEFKTDGELLLSNFNRLSQKRHEIVHGALIQLPINGLAMFTKLEIKDNLHHRHSVPFDWVQSQTLTQELQRLGNDTANLANRLLDNLP